MLHCQELYLVDYFLFVSPIITVYLDCAHIIRNFIPLRYETTSFSAPIIIVYCPGFKSMDGVIVNDTI